MLVVVFVFLTLILKMILIIRWGTKEGKHSAEFFVLFPQLRHALEMLSDREERRMIVDEHFIVLMFSLGTLFPIL